ncbi:MAG: UvrD-helicase domain-containing protein [Bdellovibrionota bacterium]|nr:UvrD-helicase domain-containing protein [Bdellovibrionota bacterium]
MQSEASEFLKETKIVRAGAGAGKTRNLTLRVLDWVKAFFEQEGRPPKLVVTTFTVKATQELRERLLLFASEQGDPLLIDYVRSGNYLQISTIHGVLSSFLRKYGHGIGLDSGFEVISGMDNRKSFFYWAWRIMESNEKYEKLLSIYNFSDLSKFLVRYYESFLLGKELSPTNTHDIEMDLQNRFKEFQNQCREVGHRVVSLAEGPDSKGKTKENWIQLGNVLLSLTQVEFAEMEDSLSSAVSSISRKPSNPSKNPILDDATHQEASDLWDQVKEMAKWPEEIFPFVADYQEYNECFQEFANDFVQAFLQDRLQNSSISMADIEFFAAYLLRKKPDFALSFASEFDYWMIDEFQDTSPEQLHLLKHFIDESPYYLVGDPQQSIYYFRGADQTLFHKEEERLRSGEGAFLLLMKNYRTKPDCMEFINEFMGQFGFSSMETRDYKETEDPDQAAAEFLIAEDIAEENWMIANRITQLLNEGVAPSDICILSRTKKAMLEISACLQEKDVPHYLHTSGSFYERREILDLLALLKFLVHPHDSQNIIELLRSPWFFVEDEKIFDWVERKEFSWEQLKSKDEPSIETLSSLKEFAEEYGISSALEKSIFESGILESARKYDSSGKREANVWKFLCDLREGERKAFFSPLSYLRRAEELAEVTNEGELEAAAALEPNRVQLMTIHASKGLEFPHVFVCRMNKKSKLTLSMDYFEDEEKFCLPVPQGEDGVKRLPLFSKEKIKQIQQKEKEESHRLLYVALTRAEKCLYLSWSDKIEKNSWLEDLAWELSDETYKREKYSYLVRRNYQDISLEKNLSNAPEWIDQWQGQEQDYFKPLETDSVSKLLEQRTEYGRQQKKGEEEEFYTAEHFKKRMDRAADGTRLHSVLENYVAAVSVQKEDEFVSALEAEEAEIVDALLAMEDIPFSELFHRAHLEWGFILKLDSGRIIEGQIDFWAKDDSEDIWLLDYKTGSSHFSDKAFEQLKIYAFALHRFYPDANINMAIAYVKEGKALVQSYDPSQALPWS